MVGYRGLSVVWRARKKPEHAEPGGQSKGVGFYSTCFGNLLHGFNQ